MAQYTLDKTKFNSAVPNTAVSIIFTDIAVPSGITATDISVDSDNSIVSWLNNDIYYVSTKVTGQKIIAPSSCYQMFYNYNTLTTLDLSKFDTTKVTNMSYMFYNCNALTTLNLSSFNTSNVINMSNMFDSCNTLTSLDLSNFNTSKVTNMSYMFNYCYRLTKIKLGTNFSFNGAKTTRLVSLPTPDKTYISMTNGRWTNIETGESYLGTEVPNNIAATYCAYIDTTWEYEAKKCIDIYKQTANVSEIRIGDICDNIANSKARKNIKEYNIYFSNIEPIDEDGEDGDLWVVIN